MAMEFMAPLNHQLSGAQRDSIRQIKVLGILISYQFEDGEVSSSISI